MRTEKQIVKAANKITGCRVVGKVEDGNVCGIWNVCCDARCLHYDSTFIQLSATDQDTILYHEVGHLEALKDPNSANTKLYGPNVRPDVWCSSNANDLAFAAECEADLWAAKQVGVERMLRILHNPKCIMPERQQTRVGNLMKVWEKQPRKIRWLSRFNGVFSRS